LLFSVSSFFTTKEGMNLARTSIFYIQSEGSHARVSDVREGTVDDFSMMLPSGELLWQGDSYYRPLVRYTHPRTQNIHVLELPDASATDYAIDAELALRVSMDDEKLVRESHGFFLWGRSLFMTSFGLLSMLIFYILFRRHLKQGKTGKGRSKTTKGRSRARKSPAKRAPLKKAHPKRA